MSLFATLRQQRRTAPLLGVVVMALLSIAAIPCTMASSGEIPAAEAAHVVSSDTPCPHATSTKPMSEADCCCDPGTALNIKKQELPKPGNQLTLAVSLYLLAPLIVEHSPVRPHIILASATSQPIYLSTQRLRL